MERTKFESAHTNGPLLPRKRTLRLKPCWLTYLSPAKLCQLLIDFAECEEGRLTLRPRTLPDCRTSRRERS